MQGLTEKLKLKILLVCRLCAKMFSVREMLEGGLEPETGICRECYRKLQMETGTCFGKKTVGKRLGYDEEAVECREFCPDKRLCKSFVEKNAI